MVYLVDRQDRYIPNENTDLLTGQQTEHGLRHYVRKIYALFR